MTLNGIRLFAGPVDDPRARRASDVIQLVISSFFLAILAVIAIPPTTIERALITFVAASPDFLDGLWQVLADLFFVAAVFLLVASAVRRRLALVRDLLLAALVAGALALVIGRLLEGEWLPGLKTLREVGPPPWVPALRIAVLGAVLLTARPNLSRPARRLTVWLVGLASVSAVLLEATTPSGALAAPPGGRDRRRRRAPHLRVVRRQPRSLGGGRRARTAGCRRPVAQRPIVRRQGSSS